MSEPKLADYATPEMMRLSDAGRYAEIIKMRGAIIAKARTEQAFLTRWAAVQIRRLAAQGLSPEQIVAKVRAAGGQVSAPTVRRILAQKVIAQ